MSSHGLPRALTDLRVVEIGDSTALSYAGKLLAEFGADVLKVELPNGDDSRRRVPVPDVPPTGSGGEAADGVLHRWINNSKRSLVLDWHTDPTALTPLLDGADIVISAVPSPAASASATTSATASALTPDALREGRPHLIVAHVSDFGPDGPLASWRGGELILYALTGLLAASGPYDRPPLAHGTGVAWLTSGVALAVGILVAHWERGTSGHGQALDVAQQDAMIGAQAALPFITSFSGISTRRGGKDLRVDLGVLPCADGYIASVIGRDGWERLVALLGEPDLMQEKYLDRGTRVAYMEEALEIVLRRLKEEPRDHWFHGAQELRMPFAKVQGARDLAECPQLNDRGYFITVNGADGRHMRMPSRPFLMHGTPWRMTRPAPLLGDTDLGDVDWEPRPQPSGAPGLSSDSGANLPLAGIRVIELGTAWAGPCGTKILADLGADVIKIESPTHPDNARVAPYTDGDLADRFFDRNVAYLIANTSKAHTALELSRPHAQELFKRLAAGADVVFENYTPHVMEQFGLTHDQLRQVNPNLIMLSTCGYGHTGPWSDYAAYGWSLEPGSGIADVTGYPDGPPVASAIPYPDIATALHAAFAVLLALEHRRRTGEGQWIDVAQYELAALSGLTPLLHYMTTGEPWGRHGNHHPWYAPHNIYPTRPDGSGLDVGTDDDGGPIHDAWVAIAIEHDDEWPRLVAALDGALPDRPEWATFEARKTDEDAIDAAIGAWTNQRTNVEAAEFLQAAGVRAAPVNRYDQALRNPQPWHRGYLVRAEHEESGARIVPGVWQRFSRTPGRVRWAAPNFGAQNRLVLQDILGLSDAELATMAAEGETADTPTGLARPPLAGLPIEQTIELGLSRGLDADYLAWNQAGPVTPLPTPVPLTWGPVQIDTSTPTQETAR